MFRVCVVLVTIVLAAAPALADSAPTKPWEQGISPEDQARARALFDQGNALLIQGDVTRALARYEQAVEVWDHPAIRFNMAIVLIKLDRPVEAYDSIERALEHPDALEPSEYAQAQNYKLLLEGQVAELQVTCTEPGARVTLDGKYLFTGGAGREVTVRVRTGEHQVVASKPGQLTETHNPKVMPRILNRVDVGDLVAETPVVRRRWPRLQPWTLVGLGAAITVAGVPMRMQAQTKFDQYRQEVDARCADEGSCLRDDLRDIRGLESRGTFLNRAAVASFVAGGALLAAGLTLVILNQPRPVKEKRPAITITPQIHSHGIGIGATGTF